MDLNDNTRITNSDDFETGTEYKLQFYISQDVYRDNIYRSYCTDFIKEANIIPLLEEYNTNNNIFKFDYILIDSETTYGLDACYFENDDIRLALLDDCDEFDQKRVFVVDLRTYRYKQGGGYIVRFEPSFENRQNYSENELNFTTYNNCEFIGSIPIYCNVYELTNEFVLK